MRKAHAIALTWNAPGGAPADLDVVAAHLAARRTDRRLTLAFAGALAMVLAVGVAHVTHQPVAEPDPTFHSRI